MATVYPNKTVGEYVMERPSLSRVFERYGIDYCCGGKKPLIEVCRENGIAVDEVLKALAQAEASGTAEEEMNWSESTLVQMVDHIYERHHRYLYEVMPRLSQMANKVARVHGSKDSRLQELALTHDALQNELISHMAKEEQVLFPFCRQFEAADGQIRVDWDPVRNPIRVMENEHEEAGKLLAKMRFLTDGYIPPEWACNTYRALLDGLAEMEADIHQHIHKENNILFPKTLQMMETTGRK